MVSSRRVQRASCHRHVYNAGKNGWRAAKKCKAGGRVSRPPVAAYNEQ